MKETKIFIEKLFFDENHKDYEKTKQIDNYANLLSEIFYDVEGYNHMAYNKIEDIMNNGAKNLKEVFSPEFDEERGIHLMFPCATMTKAFFSVMFYDEKFVATSLDFKTVLDDLSAPKYQKRYVNAMYKLFGEPYKEHYKKIMTSQIKELEEGLDFIK